MNSKEELNSRKMTLKAQYERADMEIGEVKKRLSGQFKEISVIQKSIASIESRVEQKRADRHSLLQQCKVRREIIIIYDVRFQSYNTTEDGIGI